MNTGRVPVRSDSGLLTTIAWGIDGLVEYALEGSVFVGGAAVQWLRDEMKLIEEAPDSEWMAAKVADTCGVYVVPAFVGLGAPYWDPYARGLITGLTRGANKYHIIRATLESIAYQTHDLIAVMHADAAQAAGGAASRQSDRDPISILHVDGGASANHFLMQFQADVLGMRIERPECLESTALGAAYLAGLAAGYWADRSEIAANRKPDRIFLPEMDASKRQRLLDGWAHAVRTARYRGE
jgi:glycerol kinase